VTVIRVDDGGAALTITVAGALDDNGGGSLAEAVRAALVGSPSRLDVDLQGITSFTVAGAAALRTVGGLAAMVPGGVHYRTGGGAGADALLAAYDDPIRIAEV
jgi:hypothetical protein